MFLGRSKQARTMLTPIAPAAGSGAATIGAPRPGGDSISNYLSEG
jgi:hypothetical protein